MTRAKDERIIIQGGFVITINRFYLGDHGKPLVSIGVTAPPDVWIRREEVHERILAAQEATDGGEE